MNNRALICYGGGRLGNQLFSLANLLAWQNSLGKDWSLVNIGFWPYYQYFCITQGNPACIVPNAELAVFKTMAMISRCSNFLSMNSPGMFKRAHLLLRKLAVGRIPSIAVGTHVVIREEIVFDTLDLSDLIPEELVGQADMCILTGWRVRSWQMLRAQWSTIKQRLRPVQAIEQAAAETLSLIRPKGDLVIGIHMRQGDYSHYKNGDYYFSRDQYITWINQLRIYFADQNPIFLLVGDAILPPFSDFGSDCFASININPSRKNPVELAIRNLTELSLCDLIVGPPSTFSAWASLIGEKRLLPLFDVNQSITESTIFDNFWDSLANKEMMRIVGGW